MEPHHISTAHVQVYRLQNKVDLALADLTMALELSGGRGKAAEQAFTQRGLIHSLHGNNQQARTDFQAAAKLGSTFSQKQVCFWEWCYLKPD